MNNPFLIGEKIYLRSIEETDLTSRYREWFNDAEVCEGNSHHRFPNYNQNMQEYFESTIRSRANLVLAICDKETDLHVGNVSLLDIDAVNQVAEFAILIGDKEYWGKQIGSEAMKLIVSHGFRELHLHRIYFGTFDSNIGMQQLGLTHGFQEEGRSREAVWKAGKWKSIFHYGILSDEWKY